MKITAQLSSSRINTKIKHSKCTLFITLLFFLFLTGCGGSESNNEVAEKPPPINFSDYYPLIKRVSHDYNITNVSGDLSSISQILTTGLTYNGQASVRICESAIEWEDQAYVNGQTLSYAFTDDTGTTVKSDVPIIMGVDNWQAGKTIRTSGTLNYGYDIFPFKIEVTYIEIEPVTVPAGNFPDSIKVNFSINDGNLTGTSWYAKGVGLIKESDSDGEIWELSSQNTLPPVSPLLSNIEPVTGSLYGGSLVTLTGIEFKSDTKVTIGGQLVESIYIMGPNSIMAVTPPGVLGSANVTVTNPDCQVAHIEKGYVFNDGTIPPPSIANWKTEVVDDPKFFSDFYSRAIAVDSQGRPHIVYGGDHLYYAFYDGTNWQYEIADPLPGVGKYASIVLDTGGKAHIGYFKEGSRQVKYATNSNGSWTSEIVSGSLSSIGFISTAIDSSGYIHISYTTNMDIKYATNKSGVWLVETVEAGASSFSGLDGINTSIAIDASGKAHVSYFYGTDSSLKYATNASGLWVAVTVDDAPNAFAGLFNSLAIDSQNKIHIGYYYVDYDTNIAAVKHASNASGFWSTETVFNSVDNGGAGSASIAVDSSDNIHFSYSDWSAPSVRYATNTSGSWVTDTVDTIRGQITSIALDASSNAHISYYDPINRGVKYATNASGEWLAETLDNSTEMNTIVGKYTSLAIDSTDKLHISYFDAANDPFYGSLKHATDISSSWVTEMIDPGGAQYNSMALDSVGNLHISYAWAGGLKYTTNASGTWVNTTVDNDPSSQYSSISVDQNDKIHISYYSDNPMLGGLRYATNTSGSWVIETLESGWGRGKYNSIFIDSSGKAHISYSVDSPTVEVRYATNSSGSWITKTVDTVNGIDTDIVTDSSGVAHISYHVGAFYGGLKYATNLSGSWRNEVIDNGAGVGLYTSIAVDSLNKIHISYYDQVYSDLRHATNRFCAWVPETVESNGAVGMYSSIGIDSLNKVHISYYDEDSGSLRYAVSTFKPDYTTNCAAP